VQRSAPEACRGAPRDPRPGRADSRRDPRGDFPAVDFPQEKNRGQQRRRTFRLIVVDLTKPRDLLRQGVAALYLDLDERQIELLIRYLELLAKWNRAYNLTAVEVPLAMVNLHLLDSLSIAPHLRGERFIDVGTGPGLPGIPLAIALPDRHFTLLDSNGKRVRFLFQVRTALGLGNVREVQSRAEAWRDGPGYDGIISRAYSAIDTMLASTAHLLAP